MAKQRMTVDDLVDREDDEPLPDADESGNLIDLYPMVEDFCPFTIDQP